MNRTASRGPRTAERRDQRVASPSGLLGLLANGTELSGNAAAAELGITRAAVWKQIEQLRAHGLPIQAEAGRGYRLEAPIELLDLARIESAIPPNLRARIGAIDLFWQIHSTSSELTRRAAASTSPCACLAEVQTRGRGRRGRAWQTPLAGAIALSFLRSFEVGMAELAGLSLVAGIAVLRAFADCGIDGAALKWPNDVVARGRKLGGILVELGGDALGPCHAVVGIGINLRIPQAHGETIDQPWTDVATLIAGEIPSRNLLAASVLARVAEALDTFATEGFAAFEREYARHDALRGSEILVSTIGEPFAAIADGVTERGALRIICGGTEREIDSAEVSVRRVDASRDDVDARAPLSAKRA
ncbi:MAG TPA: biotin--[acetyl-CoA-carboxylase] ligase [Rhodanobacteraceae bacterium]|jgi:BirA family biotin operon repressor/biotin-[acetyl-CoA-carboxylase] ligase|nr:biotin--[acetyl-CoA-carboxylase] ligase [Rhodanobacteraceae bacterium]